ncbi:nucleoside triphosphate pyrophosphohydrolase [Bacillus sp. FJAT-49736]|uniref:nucleoside triphosphate pyrophosphohydrolase n=1 Tax=Bacillus sp. FJAT-49736 TaxID=2833582 RepID=UPI001BC8E70E|nr:nucleoside triphosphate pyrophosphohydrolase [Bacillus sp. FJAT-49736]MBS4175765.1 nucleoside triphosphate pyrophosphohydrolase [Bacillus sp. FJAT-49736]
MSNCITIIGLGAGDLDQLPLGVYKLLKNASTVFLRTKEHPVVKDLEAEGLNFISFDDIYEQYDRFEEVYEEIVNRLFIAAKQKDIIYAVPGHPLVAERTVQLLLEESGQHGLQVHIAGGQSFIDPLFTAVKADPIEGFQLLDGTDLKRDDIQTNQHLIIGQVYDAFVASNVKLTLMEKYPDDYSIMIVTAAGTTEERIEQVLLYELDRQLEMNNLTSVYVPPMKKPSLTEFSSLRSIIADLRGPNGCPWDKEQTHLTLKKYLIEESYELLEAIDEDDIDHIIEELGDVLLQVMLHAQIGEDEGMFTIDDVIERISDKMIRRHPHVFGDVDVNDVDDVIKNWSEIKEQEKGREKKQSILDEVAKGFPAIMKAYEYQKKASKLGFDWNQPDEAWKKVLEEMKEFQTEITKNDREKQLSEYGDLLFAMVNVGRLLSIYPEEALEMTNQKFRRRFRYMEEAVENSERPFSQYTLAELDELWDKAKKAGL